MATVLRGRAGHRQVAPIASDEDAAHGAAAGRLRETLEQLKQAGIAATGSVGTDDPVQALGDAALPFGNRAGDRDLDRVALARGGRASAPMSSLPSVELIVVTPVVSTGK